MGSTQILETKFDKKFKTKRYKLLSFGVV